MYNLPSSDISRGLKQYDGVEGPLRGKVGQASLGTAVTHSHYCSSIGLEEKVRSRHMATLPRLHPVPCHTHYEAGMVAPGSTTCSLHSSCVWQGSGA